MSAQFTVILDANVLYSAPVRDLILQLAVMDLFQARWSQEVLLEVGRSLRRNRADIDPEKIDRLLSLMNENVRDSLVEFPAGLIESIEGLPDPDDRHVVAAALVSRSHAIVTSNVKDFPQNALAPYRTEAITPDDFLLAQWDLDQGRFLLGVTKVRNRLKNPSMSADQYLASLRRCGLVKTAAVLTSFTALI